MKIKTKHIVWSGVAGLMLLNGPNLAAIADQTSQINQKRQASRYQNMVDKAAAKSAQERSAVALERAKSCVLVVDSRSKQPGYLTEGATVTVAQGAKTPLSDDRIVCNQFGDTAIVRDGRVADLAAVTREDLQKFKKILGGSNEGK